MLNVTSAKAIFYKGVGLTVLKTAAELGAVVDKRWLSNAYCPGANDDAQLANLLADRKLSYFKGYGYDDNVQLSTSFGMTFTSITATWILSPGWSAGASQNKYYYQDQFLTSQMTVTIGGTYPGFNLYLRIYINDVLQSGMTQTITGTGVKYVTLPAAMAYPSKLKFTIGS